MPLWPSFTLVAIALICPSSYLLLGWGCKSDKPILLHSAPTPPGSPMSSERPVDSWRGGVEGSWTLPVAWLATDVGVVEEEEGGGSKTIRIGLLRWQLASKKEEGGGRSGETQRSVTWPQCPAGGSFHGPPPATCWMTIWGSGKTPTTEVASSS